MDRRETPSREEKRQITGKSGHRVYVQKERADGTRFTRDRSEGFTPILRSWTHGK